MGKILKPCLFSQSLIALMGRQLFIGQDTVCAYAVLYCCSKTKSMKTTSCLERGFPRCPLFGAGI